MITFDDRELLAVLAKLEAACDELPQIAETVRGEALGHAQLQSDLNIYRTTPGKYVRTGAFRQGIQARQTAAKNSASVTIINAVDYALYVEVGRQGMDLGVLQTMALANPGQLLTLGRSGQNWTIAAPVVTAAQAFALYRLQQLFVLAVKNAVK
ncbi:hypothetical protein [Deinococcus humi]|uniref:Flagellar motor switch/type III secretory pathway protein FliN n=1 Tax=Deinococcus humi TaxID=662880 RepID=A0A7W8NDX2_9DEIO|nr:hypothetical protein [Deinococcus humi]MBB5362070.1 flagellar motor switch/type III secretory pathway protein FliN [Deinococcus humi]GGO22226.1 hypothetical protein GCM10008949_09250 [Deinococcus humi]